MHIPGPCERSYKISIRACDEDEPEDDLTETGRKINRTLAVVKNKTGNGNVAVGLSYTVLYNKLHLFTSNRRSTLFSFIERMTIRLKDHQRDNLSGKFRGGMVHGSWGSRVEFRNSNIDTLQKPGRVNLTTKKIIQEYHIKHAYNNYNDTNIIRYC